MILTKVRAAFRTKLLTVLSNDKIAWENRPFEPVKGTPYLRERLAPQRAILETLGPHGRVRHRGTLFLDYFSPIQVGLIDAETFLDTLLAAFAPAVVLTYSGQTVTVESSSRQGIRIESEWVMTPCTIVWYADWTNTAV